MAESLAYFDRAKEPRVGFEPPVAREKGLACRDPLYRPGSFSSMEATFLGRRTWSLNLSPSSGETHELRGARNPSPHRLRSNSPLARGPGPRRLMDGSKRHGDPGGRVRRP